MADVSKKQFSELVKKIEGLASIERKKSSQNKGLSKKQIKSNIESEKDRQKFLKKGNKTSKNILDNILMGILGHGTKNGDPGIKIKDGAKVSTVTSNLDIKRIKNGMFSRWGTNLDAIVKILPSQWDVLLKSLGVNKNFKNNGSGINSKSNPEQKKSSVMDLGQFFNGGIFSKLFGNNKEVPKEKESKDDKKQNDNKISIIPEIIIKKNKGSKLLTFLADAYVDGLKVTKKLTGVLQSIVDVLVDTMGDIGKDFLKQTAILSASLIMLSGALVVFATGMAFMIPVTFLSIFKFLTVAFGITLLTKLKPKIEGAFSLSLSFALIGLGLMIFTPQLKEWENITWGGIGKFLAFSLGLSLVLFLVGTAGAGTVLLGALQLAISFAMIGLSLMIFTPPFKKLSHVLTWGGILKFLAFSLGFSIIMMLSGLAFPFILLGAAQLALSFYIMAWGMQPLAVAFGKFAKLDSKKLWKSLAFLTVLALSVAALGPFMFIGGGLFAIGSILFSAGLYVLALGFKAVNKPFMEFGKTLAAFGKSIKSFVTDTVDTIVYAIDKLIESINKMKRYFGGGAMSPAEARAALEKNKALFNSIKEIGISAKDQAEIASTEESTKSSVASVGRMMAALVGEPDDDNFWGNNNLSGDSFMDILEKVGSGYDKINAPVAIAKLRSLMSGIGVKSAVKSAPEMVAAGSTESGPKGETQESLLGDIRAVLSASLKPQLETAFNTRQNKGKQDTVSPVPKNLNFQISQ